MIVRERGIFDVDLPDDADADLVSCGARDRGELIEDALVELFRMQIIPGLERLFEPPLPCQQKLIRCAALQLVGAALVRDQHQQIAVEHRVEEFQEDRGGHLPAGAGILFQSGEVQGDDRHLRELLLQCLPEQVNIIGGAAAAAGLRDEQRGAVRVVTAGFQCLHELPDDQQCRIAGIVVHVFEPLVHDGAAGCPQQLAVVAVGLEYADQQLKMYRQHVRYENGMCFFHLRCEPC